MQPRGGGRDAIIFIFCCPVLVAAAVEVDAGSPSSVTDAVVGSTPTLQCSVPSSALMSDDFPALNSPTVVMRKMESAW